MILASSFLQERSFLDVLYIVAFYLVYSVVRNLQGADASRARAHALDVTRAEKMPRPPLPEARP